MSAAVVQNPAPYHLSLLTIHWPWRSRRDYSSGDLARIQARRHCSWVPRFPVCGLPCCDCAGSHFLSQPLGSHDMMLSSSRAVLTPQVGKEASALDHPNSSPVPTWPALTVHFACSLSVQAELKGRRLGRHVGGTGLAGMCTHTDKPFPGPDHSSKSCPSEGAGQGEGDTMMSGKSMPRLHIFPRAVFLGLLGTRLNLSQTQTTLQWTSISQEVKLKFFR